ncbi:hypothetical protein TSAR_012152 [Trichomalopsis sarcophagae]|uniref:Uncharacterized protein n=1 Tax=Trichomalopsis sarcophagae TaxID=543379 RepID=A0A232FL63_9HYME|nr:hypothetical protein TSAR_012152 [Trichomalopsis sarcophagae]
MAFIRSNRSSISNSSSKRSLQTVQEKVCCLIDNAPTLLMMLEHVSWAMEAIQSLPPLSPFAAMQQLYNTYASPRSSRKDEDEDHSSSHPAEIALERTEENA